MERIDLHKWFIEMNDLDYRSYSPAHKAVGSFHRNGKFFMTNVENIGFDSIIQNYELKDHAANGVQLYSEKTVVYIWRLFPVKVSVPWEMKIEPLSATTCRFTCMIGVDYPNLLIRVANWFNGLGGLFLRKHLSKEGKAFAKDIERKFK